MRILTILVCLLATAFSVAQQTSVASHDYYLVEEDSLYYSEVEEWTEQEQCLIETIYFEARGEPFLGQVGVGVVVMRRVQSDKFPDNICDVVYQKNQFSWTHLIKDQTPRERKAWWIARAIAHDVMNGKSEDNTGGANFYHATYVDPAWNKKSDMIRTTKIGIHIFYDWRGNGW